MCIRDRVNSGSGTSSNWLKPYVHKPIRDLFPKEVVVLSPTMGIREAFLHLDELKIGVAIVQETSDTILGVVSIDTLARLILSSDKNTSFNSSDSAKIISSVMARNISIEPDDATLLEIIERISVGHCQFVVVVDERGNPSHVLHEKNIQKELFSRF